MTSVKSGRTPPMKHMSLGLLRHDEATGTITLDIHNVQNGDLGMYVLRTFKILQRECQHIAMLQRIDHISSRNPDQHMRLCFLSLVRIVE